MKKKKKETSLVKIESFRPSEILENKEKEILNYWINDLKKNKIFKEKKFVDDETFIKESKEFLDSLVAILQKTKIPNLEAKEFFPILQVLRKLSKSRRELGCSIKDTAVYILSLKNSFQEYIQKIFPAKDLTGSEEVKNFNNLLDLLGLFVLESFVHEKEDILKKKEEEIRYLRSKAIFKKFGKIVGKSKAIQDVYKAIGQVLENDVTVLILGETGTGKELVANAVHYNSIRKKGPFVIVNCSAIPEKLLESELFGYERGAFTGAEDTRIGKFELANGGTIFLDEVGELSLAIQVKLLRTIQYKEIERLGGTSRIKVDVRIIAASNKDLKKEVDEGKFRSDLFYRLNVFPIFIPPLRERKEDIMPLAFYFLEKANEEVKKNVKKFDEKAVDKLLKYNWPGNVRELENKIMRAVILATGSVMTADLFILEEEPISEERIYLTGAKGGEYPVSQYIKNFNEVEKEHLKHTLEITKGNIKKAAEALGISRTTLYNKMNKYGLR